MNFDGQPKWLMRLELHCQQFYETRVMLRINVIFVLLLDSQASCNERTKGVLSKRAVM